MAADVEITYDSAAMRLFCETPGSPVDHAMSMMADYAVLAMKARCPVSPHDTPATARWPARRSGTLRSSIMKFRSAEGDWIVGPTERLPDGRFLGVLISQGTPPHPIDALGPWSLHDPVGDRYFGPHVDHPGTRPNPFIRETAADLNRFTIRIG